MQPEAPSTLSFRDKRLLLRCLITVAYIRLGLTAIGYKRLKTLTPKGVAPAPEHLVARISAAVIWAARRVPRASCLTQALAAQSVLARQGFRSTVRVGVRLDEDGRYNAHAWLLSEDRVVVGGEAHDLGRFAVLTDLDAGRS